MEDPRDLAEARALQEALRERVRLTSLPHVPRTVAGVDAAFRGDRVVGVACLYTYPHLALLQETHAVVETRFPYVPGFLSFREGPAIMAAVRALKSAPHVLLVDGQGIAHPRGLGIAAHLGVLLDLPAVGCAKSRLVGHHREPGWRKGEWCALKYRNRVVGAVLRTRDRVRPVFVSPGHRINLAQSLEIVLACTGKYRIPEPLRRADALSKEIARTLPPP